MTKFQGQVFIVPNSLYAVSDVSSNRMKGELLLELAELSWDSELGFDDRFEDVDLNEPLVQVWMTGSECDNWADHGYGALEEAGGGKFRVRSLPASAFKEMKEGDTFEFRWKGVEIHLTLAQSEFRYRRFGNFEDVLEQLLNKWNARQSAA